MEYFKSLSQSDLVNLILHTKNELFISLPAIHTEVANAVVTLDYTRKLQGQDVNVHLIIDFDAQTFRQGYGECQSVIDLKNSGFQVSTLKDNRISFIIYDDIGYYLFIESRSLIPADKKTINAVKIDPVSLVRLKKYFFGNEIEIDFQNEITNAIIEESKVLRSNDDFFLNHNAQVEKVTYSKVDDVVRELKRNPPLNPDFKRIVEYYSNKFQYVKLKFEGANIQHRKIEIPPNVLPIVDANLRNRLETKLNIFDTENNNEAFREINDFKKALQDIRDKYLTKVKSREESLLDKNNKQNFIFAIDNLRENMKEVQNNMLIDVDSLMKETKRNFATELREFLTENPKAMFRDGLSIGLDNKEYIVNKAKEKADKITSDINWPDSHELIDGFKIDLQFSDITFEDLKNQQFIKELKEKGLITVEDENQLANFGKAIDTK